MDRERDPMIALEIEGEKIITFNDANIVISAQIYFDGDIGSVCDKIPNSIEIEGGKAIFCDKIKTKSGMLSVTNADDVVLSELPVASRRR